MSDTTSGPEPSLAEVLAAVRDLRTTTVSGMADTRRDIQRRLADLQRNIHLEIRAFDARLAVIEAAVEDVRGLAHELLAVAHTHPDQP